LAMGAIASGGARIINDDVVASLDIADEAIERVALREEEEIAKQEEIYRGARPRMSLTGKAIILVDDGLATGATMRAAVSALRENRPKKIVVAVPTAPAEVCAAFDDIVDETICLTTPRFFMGVGDVYRDFSQTTNQEVREMLEDAGEKEEASWPNV
jgi:putative phosphoribosyl transferase